MAAYQIGMRWDPSIFSFVDATSEGTVIETMSPDFLIINPLPGPNGVEGVTIYQESYDPRTYSEVHPAGQKADYHWRLDTPDRVGQAGMRRVGIGSLLGLSPWRFEAAVTRSLIPR